MSDYLQNPYQFVSRLSPEQRAALMAALIRKGAAAERGPLSTEQMLKAEAWLWQRASQGGSASQRYSRTRLWLIFMLIRYGGLRLRETRRITELDFRFSQEEIRLAKRTIPLPPEVARKLADFWATWPGRSASSPLECDASFVRRSLAACAKACGIDASLLNTRALRRQRALELEAGGLHPQLIELFLGKIEASPLFPGNIAWHILKTHVKQENQMKTTARTVFSGKVCEVSENGILVSVIFETAEGLRITAIITRTSCMNLGLAPGVSVSSLIKATFITVSKAEKFVAPNDCNFFPGKVEALNRDALACEIIVKLPQGNRIYCFYANGMRPDEEIQVGSDVVVSFSPLAVILTEA